ncbi:golgi-body localization protein domain-containing protein [Cytidiella melzeri]|nr:golgi-body localization protein domain-containing protein [Cytidiella melzeri]
MTSTLSFTVIALFCSTLVISKPQDSASATVVLWLLRVVTFSLLFRSFLGPAILRLVSSRLRVQSVSLRSIRGIYFRAGKGILHIDRLGLSYHRPHQHSASRFSIRVEGFRLELVKAERTTKRKFRSSAEDEQSRKKRAARAAKRTWVIARVVAASVYSAFEPHARPVLRKAVIAVFRIIIRALPALTQVLDLDLDSAVVSSPSIVPGAEIVLSRTRIHAGVAFTQLDNSADGVLDGVSTLVKHRRFASVADLNTRVKNSFKRTLGRAWGSTHVAASVTLEIDEVGCLATRLLLEQVEGYHSSTFLSIPRIKFSTSVRLDPRQTIERHGLEVSLSAGEAAVDADVLHHVLNIVKQLAATTAEEPPTSPPLTLDVTPMSPPGSSLSPSLSPRSSRIGWASPISPTSPIMEALSARFKWAQKHKAAKRLRTTKIETGLAIVKAIHIDLSSLTLMHGGLLKEEPLAGTFRACLRKVSLSATLSHPERVSLHRERLGRTSAPGDPLTADVYAVDLSVKQFTLDRIPRAAREGHMRVAQLGPVGVGVLASQWPTPWLQGPAFLSGDPNAQFVAVQISLGELEITERLEVLSELLKKPKSPVVDHPTFIPSILSPVPRVSFGLHLGHVCLRLVSSGTHECDSFALETRTNGLVISAESQFRVTHDQKAPKIPAEHDRPRLQMVIRLSAELERTFVNVVTSEVCAVDREINIVGGAGYPGEHILSLDAIRLTGNGHAVGEMADETGGGVTIDVPSVFMDMHCSTDALSIELWQPDAVASLRHVLAALQKEPSTVPTEPVVSHHILNSLPGNIAVSFALSRFMVFITSPDLAPGEELNISRGIAFHMGMSLSYCYLRDRLHVGFGELLARTQRRLQLSLPSELLATAAGGTGASAMSKSERALIQVVIWDAAVRDALSTRYVADDPFGIGDMSDDFRSQEYLRMEQITAGVVLSGRRRSSLSAIDSKDDCAVSVAVSHVRGSMHLAHAYNLLLAAQAVKTLLPPKPSIQPPSPKPHEQSFISFAMQVDIERVQMIWEFPLRMKLYTRIAALSAQRLLDNKIKVGWKSIVMAVPVEVEQDGQAHKSWEELVRLVKWSAEVQLGAKPLPIVARGETARLRIPFDYVLADLIQDVNVSVKSMKHLLRMISNGKYSAPPPPEPEEAKEMPDLSVRIGKFSVEAVDDSFESRLGTIWRAGFEAARLRLERDAAFQAKEAAILAAARDEPTTPVQEVGSEFQFTSEHTVSIEEARQRLYEVHSGAWKSRIRQARGQQAQRQSGKVTEELYSASEELVNISPPPSVPPLARLSVDGLLMYLRGPSFPPQELPSFLFREGGGLPKDTQYSLLVPMHLTFSATSLRIDSREYPLPMLNIPAHSNKQIQGLVFDSDVVIAEEMGNENSVEWIDCAIVKPHTGVHGAMPLYVAIPKTIMPVKTYANPIIRVKSDDVTDLAWGISYQPVTQDIMRIVDTLSHAPRDSSPPVGFWDKLRLVFHWRFRVLFDHDVHLHMKGSSDPHSLGGTGSGFALCWQGNPQLLINQKNDQNELVQMLSDSMSIIIPNIEDSYGQTSITRSRSGKTFLRRSAPPSKVCAKFSSGARFGVGVVLERSCGPDCIKDCQGDAFYRQCRFFDFRPHYDVKLERKAHKPAQKALDDSYNGFRSDFIHMSVSLTSSLRGDIGEKSSIHLSPAAFSHFWSWWELFGAQSLPIRQGRRYKHKRPLSPKFSKHLATLKYKFNVPGLFLTHAYSDQSKDAWTDGVTPVLGVKALIGHFTADLHQRAQETTITTAKGVKTVIHKKFYAVEVVMVDMEMRALMAIFSDPLKSQVPLEPSNTESMYRNREDIPTVDMSSPWADLDDFKDPDWEPPSTPVLHALPMVSCPRFTYFKRQCASTAQDRVESTKFGEEDSHVCFLGKEPSVPKVQLDIAQERIDELHAQLVNGIDFGASPPVAEVRRLEINTEHMITLLQNYVKHLREVELASQTTPRTGPLNYYMPSDSVSPEEWAEFDNVYQIHCPRIYMDNIIRDIMLQYYTCSRVRRGFEYHMATRAVKFIRDQARQVIDHLQSQVDQDKHLGPAQAAAQAVRKILTGGDGVSRTSLEVSSEPIDENCESTDPMKGWAEGVSLQKGHFCLLLKPQLVLRSEASQEAVCVLAAVQGKLQTYNIMDKANIDDPVSGKIMSRNFASLKGLQAFSPSTTNRMGKGIVPLEVLIDLRCASNLFDRLVPQTDAMLHYDKFNRLRLRNNATTATRSSTDSQDDMHNHLHSQNDLVKVHVPRFTVSANDRHFQAISNIVTNLVLFSNVAHKVRSERLEKMLFNYDFTNLSLAAEVVTQLQGRLRQAVSTKHEAEWRLQGHGDLGKVEQLKIEAHILLLSEELDYVFEAIKLAQDKAEDRSLQKSALLLHASSDEISWRMIDRQDQLLAKLAVRNIDFRWLNRQDGSTVNDLQVGDLQAFDGAADAEWTEILAKNEEPSTHPLVKRKLFCVAAWTVLPPVGGITIYQGFELTFHPLRLQLDTRVGGKIMEYVWPARRKRGNAGDSAPLELEELPPSAPASPLTPSPITSFAPSTPLRLTVPPRRASVDVVSPVSPDRSMLTIPTLRKTATSRSFSDLRKAAADTLQIPLSPLPLQRTKSSDAIFSLTSSNSSGQLSKASDDKEKQGLKQEADDAALMKTRSSQKTFVWVKVSSLHLMLSIMKEDSFLCRDARIRTRDLEYRNQTWSFEELVDQFIPSGRNWKGWVKIAFQQPLVPVLPVARELIAKTKWVHSKGHHPDTPKRVATPKQNGPHREGSLIPKRFRTLSTKSSRMNTPTPSANTPNEEHDLSQDQQAEERRPSKRNILKAFAKRRRSKSRTRESFESGSLDRISDHIMSAYNTPRLESAQFNDGPQRTQGGRSRSSTQATQRGLGASATHSDVISLQGSHENIIYHGDAFQQGRVGSALSVYESGRYEDHHHDDIVEHLEVIDPAIATVSTLTNAANAIVFPPLSFYSRKPTIVLPDLPRNTSSDSEKGSNDEDDLDRHVEDCLSRKDKWRRIMSGVWAFMKTRKRICSTVSFYGFNVVFWGAGIVFFLGKLYNFHNQNTQDFWVEVCQQVETGLFTATSIGLIPFRVLDTWRISRIFHWQRITLQRRRKAGLPDLYDNNDLPDPAYDENYVHVLTEKEQADLHYQQHKFMQSMTWYRPHGTFTHRAFPIDLALWICIMNDLNSFFQCLLSGCMWGLNRFQRPAWTTAITLPAAFVAGILAGGFIWWGGKKTRRHEQVEQRLRAALAMERPTIHVTGPEDSDDTNGELLDAAEPGSSSPTLGTREQPLRKDFAQTIEEEGSSDMEKERVLQEEREARPSQTTTPSFGSTQVQIADHMTVPRPEAISDDRSQKS